MSEAADQLPEPNVKRRPILSIVWLIPIVAALAAAWIAYDAVTSRGPSITIQFETAQGLVAGKTKIKFRDVEVGTVTAIDFSEDLMHVLVTAQMTPGFEQYLRDKTQFWVVRARVTAGEVTGLGTLFSGAYIGVQPSIEGEATTRYTGLESAPLFTVGVKGRHFILRSDRLGSMISVGSPVYYRKIKVGQVVAYELKGPDTVYVRVFVEAPHDELVRANTRFWNASGIEMQVDARGLRVETESLVTLMLGGIAFATPFSDPPAPQAPQYAEFTLYPSHGASAETAYTYKERYVLYFEDSVRGLAVGAPVEFGGLVIGQVTDMKLEFDVEERSARIPVVVEIEPERFALKGENARELALKTLVDMGLRARLKTGNLVTGSAYVDLGLYPREPKVDWAVLAEAKPYPELPTIAFPLEGLMESATRVLDKVNRMPLEEIGESMRDAMGDARVAMDEAKKSFANMTPLMQEGKKAVEDMRVAMRDLRTLMRKLDEHDIVPKTGKVLDQARSALASIERTLDPDSLMQADLQKLIRDLSDAARAMRALADYLERQPDALLYGKER